MATQQELALLVKVKDQASKALGGLKKKVGALGAAAKTALKAGMMVGAAAVVGAGVAAVKSSLDFKSAFDSIKVGTGASGPALIGLQEDAKRVFGSIPVDIKPAAEAVASFNTLTGASGPILQDLSKNALEAGRMLGEDTKGLVEAGGRALNVFNIEGAKMPTMLDKVFVASQSTGVGMTALLTSVQTFGPVLKNAGFSMVETTAFLASFQKAGVDVTRIMPGLNAYFRKLSEEGVTDMKGALFDTVKQIKAATTESEALNLAAQAFGAEGAQRLSMGIRSGALEIGDLIAAMDMGEGAIAATAAETDDFNEKLQVFKNNIMLALKPLGDLVLKGLNKLSAWLVAHQDDVQAFIAAFEGFVRSQVIPAIARAFERLQDIWVAIQPAVKAVTKFLKENEWAMIALGVAVLALVVALGGPITVMLALVTAGTLVLANWDKIKQTALDLWNSITSFVQGAITTVREIPILGEIFAATFENIKVVVTTAFQIIKNRVETFINAIRAIVKIVLALIHGDFGAAWEGIKQLVKVLLDGMLVEIGLVLGAIKAIIGNQLNMVVGIFGDAWNLVKNKVTSALTSIKNTITGIINWVVNFLRENWETIVTVALAILFPPAAGLFLIITHFGTIKAKVVGAVRALKDKAVEILNTLVTFFTGIPGRILRGIGNVTSTLGQKGKDLVQGLKNGVNAIWTGFASWVRGTRDRIIRMIGNLVGALYGAGWNLMEGLLNGMKAQAQRIKDWVGGLVGDIKSGITSGFGLLSPSRVMKGYGQNIVGGLIEGVLDRRRDLNRAWGTVAANVGPVKIPPLAAVPPWHRGGLVAGPPAGAASSMAAAAMLHRPVHLTIELDGRVLARAVMPAAVDELRIRTGLKV